MKLTTHLPFDFNKIYAAQNFEQAFYKTNAGILAVLINNGCVYRATFSDGQKTAKALSENTIHSTSPETPDLNLGMKASSPSSFDTCSKLHTQDERKDAFTPEQSRRIPRGSEVGLASKNFSAKPRLLSRGALHSLSLHGTDFQMKVWEALLEIPAGTTISYQQLAQKIGKPKAVRAVANAVGANPICYFIPCHRVIRSDGSLGGYSAGIERKRVLLAAEKIFF